MVDADYTKPSGFDAYWDAVLAELDATPAEPEIELIPLRETDFATLHGVQITSIGPYRLFGYLSVPKGDGPHPAIYWPPKYASVLEIIPQGTANAVRSEFVTFSLAGRGQRNSDKPFAAMFPGLLTEGLASPDSYVFRGVVADAIRGQEYLNSLDFVDKTRTVVIGNDVAMQALAIRPGATHLVCTPALFFDALGLAQKTQGYPLQEYSDYLSTYPSDKNSVANTLSHFDLRAFANRISATTLINAGPAGSILAPDPLRPVSDAISGDVTVYASEHSSYKDGLYMERWIADKVGLDAPILPEHWQ
jgi:cephalosporin-C deacetylase